METLKGKNVVMGVTGGIAAYKACSVVRLLKKLGAEVDVIMTANATRFVAPLTFETLSGRPVTTDMFNRGREWEVGHVALAKKADVLVVCPATANIIGKFACGIADDMLSTTLMAAVSPVLIAPAMNTAMYESQALQSNLNVLSDRGVTVISPDEGFLACGDNGKGRMAEPEQIVSAVEAVLNIEKDLVGKKILVTLGATAEKLDDVRCLTNFSSGKMGAALVGNALLRGAEVTVVAAKHSAVIPVKASTINVVTTREMYDAVVNTAKDFDAVIMAAAPCDYSPEKFSEVKIKSDSFTLKLVKNPDIAAQVGRIKNKNTFLVVFAAETDNLIENAKAKLEKKNADLAVLNDVSGGKVFGSDSNTVTFVTKDNITEYSEMTKDRVAELILDRVVSR